MCPQPVPSAALLAANTRLYQLREQDQLPEQAALPWGTAVSAQSGSLLSRPGLAALPGHLGWESEPLTRVLRRRQPVEERWENTGWLRETAVVQPAPPLSSQLPTPHTNWVKLYPDIGLALLRQGKTAPGRLWLALRYLDAAGEGSLRIANITKQLAHKSSGLRLCGKRQLRNLLRDGEGIFWVRDKERLWLRSAAKVAYDLGVARLTGRPVALPLLALLRGIGAFRAHLYAAFHSGRIQETAHGVQVKPIARETLAALSGVGRSSQRSYEAAAGLSVRPNYAVGELEQKERLENRAWEKGQALFELRDHCGQQGKPGRTYLAWQLPNSYFGQHQHRPKGRQRRINRELNDLVMKGMPGNVAEAGETPKLAKRYYANGKLAAKATGRESQRELYWRRGGVGNGRFALWHSMEA